MTDKPINLGDESQVKERTQKVKSVRERELDDLKSILATKPGRRFIWRMLSECKLFAVSEVPNASIYMLEGKRTIGKSLFADVWDADEDAYKLMRKESKEP